MKLLLRAVIYPLIALLVSISHIRAEDSLESLMQRMKTESAVKIAYQEIRTLELMDKPWTGSGFMYALAPDLMLREQVTPQRLLMGIKGEQLFYFDPDKGVRHQMQMDLSNPLTLNIAVFKALMNADQDLLARLYQVRFENKSQRWLMTLTAKQDDENSLTIMVSGLPGQQADTIVSRQADGDLSEFMLQKPLEEGELERKIQQLYQEMAGE